jgi:5-methylcytosine-specific restriction endonuclease McrA
LSKVFVLDTNKQPVDPVHPGWARKLLASGQAAVYRRYPFTLILKRSREQPATSALRVKLDPGSKTTGIAVVNDASGEVVFAAELAHRGQQIKAALDARRGVRRSRRRRKTHYRQPRFNNHRRPQGWLPPSLESRIANVLTWVRRLQRFCPLATISMELVKFDTHLMDNPEISGIQYCQGTLYGYEVREYLLEKWGRACTYCGAKNVPLQVEHMTPRARGGRSCISNLCLACESCNTKKGTQDIREFLKHKPDLLTRLLVQAKAPLKDAAAVNATRWALYERLQAFGLPVECGSGGLTKYNRTQRGLPKTHWLDAACVGTSTPERMDVRGVVPLLIAATGHGSRQMCRMDRFGFPRTGPKHAKRVKDFQTGDIVRAVVPTGKKTGTYLGRIAIRSTGSFNITTNQGTIQGISHRHCTLLHRADGYEYPHAEKGAGVSSCSLNGAGRYAR